MESLTPRFLHDKKISLADVIALIAASATNWPTVKKEISVGEICTIGEGKQLTFQNRIINLGRIVNLGELHLQDSDLDDELDNILADYVLTSVLTSLLALKANLASPTFTGTVGGITAAMVGAPSGSGSSTGTNTGDQTNISGNAATVTTNADLSGHVTSSGNTTSLGAFTIAQLNTAISDANVATGGGTATGTNTGDQIDISGSSGSCTGNAASATTATTATNLLGGIVQVATPVTETGTTHTLAATTSCLIANTGASTLTVTLGAASSYPGRVVIIKRWSTGAVISASSNVCPINSNTPGTSILSAGYWVILVSNGTNWIVMALQ